MKPAVTQLGYFGLEVADRSAWRDLLVEVLGLGLVHTDGDRDRYAMDQYEHRIEVADGASNDIAYVGWQVAGPREFDAVRARVDDAGLTVTPGDAQGRGVQGLFRFTDPEGLATEIFFGPRVLSRPFVPGRPMVGFDAGNLGVGHLVLAAKERDAMERFYVDTLGFSVTDYGSGNLVFLRCNPRHHSVAFMPQHLRPEGSSRLVHAMLPVLTLDDVGRAFDLAMRRRTPHLRMLGKHVNDLVISFYLGTPGGLEIEYGCGGRRIDDDDQMRRYAEREVWGHAPVAQ